ncbi:hypothetical protein A3Q56_08693, partial [Intoshia linei]
MDMNVVTEKENMEYTCKKELKNLPNNVPRMSNKKKAFIEYCNKNQIAYNDDMKTELWYKVNKYVQEYVKPVVCSMSEAEGHEVTFSPPYHSDLDPIELIWAISKGEVGRQYSMGTNLSILKDRLEKS